MVKICSYVGVTVQRKNKRVKKDLPDLQRLRVLYYRTRVMTCTSKNRTHDRSRALS